MIARSSKIFLEIVVGALIGLVLLGAVSAWRLAQGPVPLTFLTPSIQEALDELDIGVGISIGDTVLTWAGWERNLDIVAVDVRAIAPDGRVIASVPEISVNLSARGLLRGIVAPTRLELIGPRLRFIRSLSNGLELAFEDTSAMSGELARLLVRRLLPTTAGPATLSYLKHISVVGAKLTIDDRVTGAVWGAPQADIQLWRDGTVLHAGFDMVVDIGGEKPARLNGNAIYRPREKTIRADIQFADLRADLAAKALPTLEQLKGAQLTLDGKAVVELDGEGRLLTADFEATGLNGRIVVPGFWPGGLPVKTLGFSGRLQRNPDFAVIDDIRIDTGGPTFAGKAVITRIGKSAAVNGHVVMRNMAFKDIDAFWPGDLATKVRGWVLSNMSGGTVDEARIEASVRSGSSGTDGMTIESLSGTMRFGGTSVRYLEKLPPAQNVAATAEFNRDSFIITLTNSEVNGIRSESGKIEFTRLDTDFEHARIQLVLHGPLQSALRLIDHPEFRFARRVGIDAGRTAGEMATRIVFDFPLLTRLRLEDVSIGAAANLRGVSVPAFIRGQPLSDGNLKVRVDKTSLEVKGSAKLGPMAVDLEWYEDFNKDAEIRRRYRFAGALGENERKILGFAGAPYLKGVVDVDLALLEHARGNREAAVKLALKSAALEIPLLGWSKSPGTEGLAWLTVRLAKGRGLEKLDFDVRAAGLRSRGSYTPGGEGKPARVEFGKFAVGATDINGTVTGRDDGGYDVRLQGPGLDAAPLLRFDDDVSPADALPPIRITAKLDRLWFSTGPPVGDVSGTLVYDGKSWSDIDLGGTLGKDHRIALSLRKDGAVRNMNFRASNAGVALRTLGLFDTMQNGEMVLSGRHDGSRSAAPWRGQMLIKDFRIIDAPLLTRILSLGSLTGIVDAMKGQGITFARLEAPYTFKDKVLGLNRARAVGDAIGLTATGKVDFAQERLKLDGTVVPANTINSMLGNIPILGKILTGVEGAGVFAMNYDIKGPLKKPTVTVNPLTALAPGFLRDLIGVLTGTGANLPPDTAEGARPADE